MSALPKPDVPSGPIGVLFDQLHALHHRAGWPSLRDMARQVGCSHTTISAAFSEPRVPRWGLLELIVEALGGDTEQFHQLWLRASGTPAEAASAGAAPGTGPARRPDAMPPPRDLPADVAAFTGRDHQLESLDRLLASSAKSTAVLIAVLSGTAGVGKTALAVHWAHRVAALFPDGHLYVNLRGYDIDEPMQPEEALATFLRELGVEGTAIPPGLAERAARYRTLLADRRVLLVLDNAHSVEQIRELLPGSSSCFVVVTSRDALPALVARHGAVRVNLDLLPTADSLELLRTLIGERVDAEPQPAATLARQCAGLPLALRIAAEFAATRPRISLAELTAELHDEGERLDLLTAGEDEHTAVRAVFSWSVRHLSPAARDMFRWLGLHPGLEIDRGAAAALTGVSVPDARKRLDELVRAHLVEEAGIGRYGMHDLLRAYAREQLDDVSGSAIDQAMTRMYDHYVDTAETASAAYEKGDDLARRRLDTERENLLAIARAAADLPAYTVRLSAAMARYLNARSHYTEALGLHELALAAARRDGDRIGEAAAQDALGAVQRRLGRYVDALEHHRAAAGLYSEFGDLRSQSTALRGMGGICWRLGRYAEAREHLDLALEICRSIGDRTGEGNVLHNLGVVFRRTGQYAKAIESCERAIAAHRESGDLAGEGRAMNNLGISYLRLGRYDSALENYVRTLALRRETGDRAGEATALTNLGSTYEGLGRFEEALAHHQEALDISREVGYRVGQGDALRGLGTTHTWLGLLDQAIADLRSALAVARDIGEVDLETSGLNDLGGALRAAGDRDAAAEAHGRALTLARTSGDRYEEARAHHGLGNLPTAAAIYAQLGVPAPADPTPSL
ncbi:ATP-binding protein [Flindersiella endophytica]